MAGAVSGVFSRLFRHGWKCPVPDLLPSAQHTEQINDIGLETPKIALVVANNLLKYT